MTPGDGFTWLTVFCSSSSSVPSAVSSLEVESSGQTDSLTVSWQHGEGSRSSYQVKSRWRQETSLFTHIKL